MGFPETDGSHPDSPADWNDHDAEQIQRQRENTAQQANEKSPRKPLGIKSWHDPGQSNHDGASSDRCESRFLRPVSSAGCPIPEIITQTVIPHGIVQII